MAAAASFSSGAGVCGSAATRSNPRESGSVTGPWRRLRSGRTRCPRAGSRALADLVPASGSTLLVQRGASLETVTPVPGSSSSSR